MEQKTTAAPIEKSPTISPKRNSTENINSLRPRIIDELVFVPINGGFVVEGGRRFQVIQGHGTNELLPGLMRLANGTRTVGELVEALKGVPPRDITDALTFLNDAGLIEEGSDANGTDSDVNLETLRLFRRYSSLTRVNRNGHEALQRLQQTNVLILASESDSDSVNILKELLSKTGVSRIDVASLFGDYSYLEVPSAKSQLVISLHFGYEERGQFEGLGDFCWERRIPWFRAVVDLPNNYADIGPVFINRESGCYRCFHEVHGISKRHSSGQSTLVSHSDRYFWVSVLATEVVYLFSQITPPSLSRDFRRYDGMGKTFQKLRWPRVRGCQLCCPEGLASVPSSEQRAVSMHEAVVFEDYIGLPSIEYSSSKLPESRASVGQTLTRHSKRLENCIEKSLTHRLPKFDSSVLDLLSSNFRKPPEAITIDDLAALLLVTAGFRNERAAKLQRWAPTGGNLGSVELFVVCRNIMGLDNGFYFYQPREHSLAAFHRRSGGLAVEEFMHRVIGLSQRDLPDALIIFTGAFHRVSKKYGAFGYRLVNMDAGAAISQLQLAGWSLGISSDVARRWADDLISNQLNLDPPHEQVTGVVGIRADRGHNMELGPETHDVSASAKPLPYFSGLTIHDIFQQLYVGSRTNEAQLRVCEKSGSRPEPTRDTPTPAALVLPSPLQGGRLVGDILPRRITIRRYSQQSVSLDQLSSMLHYAHHQDESRWPSESRNRNLLEFIVLAWRVSGLDPAAYSYLPATNGLVLIAQLPNQSEAGRFFIQRKFGTAPVVAWIAGNLGRASELHGPFGHRQLLVRAGAAAHCMWMSAMAMGLSGAIIAGLVSGEARRRFGFDGYQRTSLLACAAGSAATFYSRQTVSEGGKDRDARYPE
jgi:SagB-type dehydrogenase family enzyme